MKNNPELPIFLESLYDPDDKYIPGYITVRCLFEDAGWPGREIQRGFNFQYLQGKVYFHVYPTGVQLPLGNAATVDEAIEIAKRFLKKWLSADISRHGAFKSEMAEKILHLEAIQRAEKEQQNREAANNLPPEILEKLQQMLQKAEEKKKDG
ncbi:MAG: hypothetical protein RBS68_15085 [Anaerolineales bacterium]|jgi:hypothetical protein|nr:hypothetical protein [Anaerolineales bacterium]